MTDIKITELPSTIANTKIKVIDMNGFKFINIKLDATIYDYKGMKELQEDLQALIGLLPFIVKRWVGDRDGA